MKLNRIKHNICKDVILRKKQLKIQYLYLLINGLLQNQNISFKEKKFFLFYKNFKLKKYSNQSRLQNVCILTGKQKTTFKLFNFNRQITKKFLDLGFITNFKKN